MHILTKVDRRDGSLKLVKTPGVLWSVTYWAPDVADEKEDRGASFETVNGRGSVMFADPEQTGARTKPPNLIKAKRTPFIFNEEWDHDDYLPDNDKDDADRSGFCVRTTGLGICMDSEVVSRACRFL